MGKNLKVALQRAILLLMPLFLGFLLVGMLWLGLEVRTISHPGSTWPQRGELTDWEQRTLNGVDQSSSFWETDWNQERYDQHIDIGHLKEGPLAELRTALVQAHEALWLYGIGLSRTGRNPLVIHLLIRSYWKLIGVVAGAVAWLILVLRCEKTVRESVSKEDVSRMEYQRLLKVCRPTVLMSICQILVVLVMGWLIAWRQTFGLVGLIVVGVLVLLVATIWQLIQPAIGRRTEKKQQQPVNYIPPMPRGFWQNTRKALGLKWW